MKQWVASGGLALAALSLVGCGASTGFDLRFPGRVVFTSRQDGNSEIYLMDTRGVNPTRLTSNSARDFQPKLSPDRSQVVFTSDRDGGDYDLYKMDTRGKSVTQLTNNNKVDADAAWSPDGTQLAFVSDRDGND
nr:DPP IV N-terminal domain-containing protein [Armatimonas sp.]